MPDFSGFVQHFPYLGLFILLILGVIGLPFPEDATLILCGFFISAHLVSPIPALFAVYSGVLIADIFLYSIGRKYGRMIVTHQRFHKILSPERFAELEGKFNKKGIFVILLGRHLVGLRAQIFLVSGIMRMAVLEFIIADAVSSVFTIAVMVGAGYMGGNSLEILKKDITRIEHIGIIAVIILFLFYLIFKYLKLIYKK